MESGRIKRGNEKTTEAPSPAAGHTQPTDCGCDSRMKSRMVNASNNFGDTRPVCVVWEASKSRMKGT